MIFIQTVNITTANTHQISGLYLTVQISITFPTTGKAV